MLRLSSRFIIAGLLPIDINSPDKVSKDIKTAKDFENRDTIKETGWDRLKRIFELDETGGLSSELNSVYQTGLLGFLIGGVYGGIIRSRKSYMDFMENNEATAFKSHLDAKRKLQDQFTVNFAKGAVKWGWRVGLFSVSYISIITAISVYREKSSIYEYLAAGSMTGALFKMNLGLRGMAAGGIVGGGLGGMAGCISLLIMRLSGTSMEEVRYWQYKWKVKREIAVAEAMNPQKDEEPELLKLHDKVVGSEITLDKIK